MTVLLRRTKRILETEGLLALMRRGLASVTCRFFVYRVYYLSEFELENARRWREEDFLPQLEGLVFRIVTTNLEADELEKEGLEFRSYPYDIDARKALDKGAMALCIFVGSELGTIGWVALTPQAMEGLKEPPLKVDFSRDALAAPVWTNPKYRRMGLRRYRTFKLRKFLLERGVAVTRGPIAKGNLVSVRALSKIDSRIYGEGRYLKLLWWTSWKEKPLDSGYMSASALWGSGGRQ